MSYYYIFRQNNSGGNFKVNDDLSIFVFIEANSAKEADSIAESKGIYFDGIETGLDCKCCGSRWHEAYDVYTIDEIYDMAIERFYIRYLVKNKEPIIIIHKLNGSKIKIYPDNYIE